MSRSPVDGPVYDLSDLSVSPMLKRRVTAVEVDLAIVGVLGVALLLSTGQLAVLPGWVWSTGAWTLGIIGVIECLTGWTLGRQIAQLRLRAHPSGAKPFWPLVVLRGVVRQLPVFVFILGTSTYANDIGPLVLFIAVTIAVLYFSMCYIALFRTGRTIFDFIGGTELVGK